MAAFILPSLAPTSDAQRASRSIALSGLDSIVAFEQRSTASRVLGLGQNIDNARLDGSEMINWLLLRSWLIWILILEILLLTGRGGVRAT